MIKDPLSHWLDMSPFQTRPCLAVPCKQIWLLRITTTPWAVTLPYSLSWDYSKQRNRLIEAKGLAQGHATADR